jgi:hypothetical protein
VKRLQRASPRKNPQKSRLPSVGSDALLLSPPNSHDAGVAPSGVKRQRPTGPTYGEAPRVNRDLLYETDKHLKRDAKFPP